MTPHQWSPSPEEQADKLLREWAAKVARTTGQDVAEVLRSVGILTADRIKVIKDKEKTFSSLQRKED